MIDAIEEINSLNILLVVQLSSQLRLIILVSSSSTILSAACFCPKLLVLSVGLNHVLAVPHWAPNQVQECERSFLRSSAGGDQITFKQHVSAFLFTCSSKGDLGVTNNYQITFKGAPL